MFITISKKLLIQCLIIDVVIIVAAVFAATYFFCNC